MWTVTVLLVFFFGLFCFCSYQNTGDSYHAQDIFHLEGCQDKYSSWCTLAIDFRKPKCSSFTLSLLNFFFLVLTYPYSTSRFLKLSSVIHHVIFSTLFVSSANSISRSIFIKSQRKRWALQEQEESSVHRAPAELSSVRHSTLWPQLRNQLSA